jgi:hypothetical protein
MRYKDQLVLTGELNDVGAPLRSNVGDSYRLGLEIDANVSLSTETTLQGKKVKQGFHRDQFYQAAEKTFDRMFAYDRNFIEKYGTKKLYRQDPKKFVALLMGLSNNEKQLALKLLRKGGVTIPNIPTNKVQLAYKTLMKLKQGVERAIRSGGIEI